MVARMPRHRTPVVRNHLPALLRRRGMTWGEFGRRTLLPRRQLVRLRAPHANPRLAVAERVATALGVAIEEIWS
jgi:DNA-binding phage protein